MRFLRNILGAVLALAWLASAPITAHAQTQTSMMGCCALAPAPATGASLPGGQVNGWAANVNFDMTHSVNVAGDTITWVSGSPTDVSTWFVLPSATPVGGTQGKWYFEVKITRPSGDMYIGLTNGANVTYIGNFGGEARALNISDGTYHGGSSPPTAQTSWSALPSGTVVGIYVDMTTGNGRLWWTLDNVIFWGLGGSSSNTAADLTAGGGGSGGWSQTMDNRQRGAGVSLFAAGQSAQLLAGSNIVRPPISPFTVIP